MAKLKRRVVNESQDVHADHVRELVRETAERKELAEQAEVKYREMQGQLILALSDLPDNMFEDEEYKAQTIASVSTKIEWGPILRKLDTATRKLVTTTTVDPKKFQAAVDLGAVDPSIVEPYTTRSHNSPYVKLTRKVGKE